MFGSELNKRRRFVGSIDPDCNVLEIMEDAYEDAKFLCEHYYSTAPTIKVDTVGGKFTLYLGLPIECFAFSALKL